ncbi:MAG: thioredoxin-like domain-containing protein [Polyangiaceae bacterium]
MPPETVHAPEFSPSLAWLNTTRPLSLRELRGQLVILDFWTYCCINCMHVLPTLRLIEERHKDDPLVVIGVHSAKFDGEKDAARIDEAIRRYDIHHPVVVDRDMMTWSAFAIRSWPTLVVIRPDGTLAAVAPGEPDAEVLDRFITEELAIARKKGQLAASPFPVDAPPRAETGALAYPGKLALGPDGAIAVADSGHHRVLVLDREGNVRHCFDGFDDPQGLAWRGASELFVADARLHTVSRIDLATGDQSIVAGTGELGEAPIRGTSPAKTTALRSPWDLLLDGDALYIALAGSHQIGKLDLRGKQAVPRVGHRSGVDRRWSVRGGHLLPAERAREDGNEALCRRQRDQRGA